MWFRARASWGGVVVLLAGCAAALGDGESSSDSGCVDGGCADAAPEGTVATPSANDGLQNQDETDVDCGGQLAPKCSVGKRCARPTDCANALCSTSGVCQDAPSCTGGIGANNGCGPDANESCCSSLPVPASAPFYRYRYPAGSTTYGPTTVSAYKLVHLALPGSKPHGNGKFGHADLAGNVYEWMLDENVPAGPCDGCADVAFTPTDQLKTPCKDNAGSDWDPGNSSGWCVGGTRVIHGGSWEVGIDLYAYLDPDKDEPECTTPRESSTSRQSNLDELELEWGDRAMSDDSRTVMLEVRSVDGSCATNATWSLLVKPYRAGTDR